MGRGTLDWRHALCLMCVVVAVVGVSAVGQREPISIENAVDVAVSFAGLVKVEQVRQPRVPSSHTEFFEIQGVAEDGRPLLVSVDPDTGEVVRVVGLCPETPLGSVKIQLREEDVVEAVHSILEQNALSPIDGDFELTAISLSSIGDLYYWDLRWERRIEGVLMATDFVRMSVNPETGQLILYSKVKHPLTTGLTPEIDADEALRRAEEWLLGDQRFWSEGLGLLESYLAVVYPNRCFDEGRWEWSESQELAWIIRIGDEHGPSVDVWVSALDGRILGGEVYERPIPELYGIPNQTGDITGIWEPALDLMMYNTSNTWLSDVPESQVVNSISNGFIFILQTHGDLTSTAEYAVIGHSGSSDARQLTPDEVPSNDLRYALVSCCYSGNDGTGDDFKDVFIAQGADVFQGYVGSINPDPYETQLVRYLAQGEELENAHNLAVAAASPSFTIVFTHDLSCLNQVRLAPLLVDVTAPSYVWPFGSFTVDAKVKNRESARYTTATNVNAKLVTPSWIFTVSGANPQVTGTIGYASDWTATWTVSSILWSPGTWTFDVEVWSDNLGVEVDDFDNPYHRFTVSTSWLWPFPLSVLTYALEPLFIWEEDRLIPGLVKSWEISDDPSVLTLSLREGVVFHDGSRLTSDVVYFNLTEEIQLLPGVVRPPLVGSTLIESVEVLDSYTLQLRTRDPSGLMQVLSSTGGLMASMEAVETLGEEFMFAPVGTGPFAIEHIDRVEQVAVCRPFRGYWDGSPRLSEVTFFQHPDPQARIAMLLSGDADVVIGSGSNAYELLLADDALRVFGSPAEYVAVRSDFAERTGFRVSEGGIPLLGSLDWQGRLVVVSP